MKRYLANLPRLAKRRLQSPILLIIAFLILVIIVLLIQYLFFDLSHIYLVNSVLIILFIIAFLGVLYIDFLRDVREQQEKILQHADDPPDRSVQLSTLFSQLSELQVEEIKMILQKLTYRISGVMKTPINDLYIRLLYRDADTNLFQETGLSFDMRVIEYKPVEEIQDILNDVYQSGEICITTYPTFVPYTPQNAAILWSAAIPVQAKRKQPLLALYIESSYSTEEKVIERGVLSILKYAFVLYHMFAETIKVQGTT